MVPQVGYEGDGDNLLILVDPYDFNPATNETDIGTTTGTTGIETIAYHNSSNLLYTFDYDRLGTLNQITGIFSPVSANPVGFGYGIHGWQNFKDIDGMSFDPDTGALYATVRKRSSNDLLIQVDLTTGEHIPGVFKGFDYAVIEALIDDGNPLIDVDDIAFDPADGALYAVVNDSHYEDHLVIIDPADGSLITNIGDFYCVISEKNIQDIEGMGFGCDGTLWAVTGNKTLIDQNDKLWEVDKTNAHLCDPRTLTHGTDYEAITCGFFTLPAPGPKPNLSGVDSGDYNGDGTSDIAIFRQSKGLWAIRGLTRVYFGTAGDRPVSADYTGDGTSNIGIFRCNLGLWALHDVSRIYYGQASDIPIPGDYDGDGSADITTFRPDTGLWASRSLTRIYYGRTDDLPVPGDYDGNGTVGRGIFRPNSGLWALRGITRAYFGIGSDQAVPGDYNGDGSELIAIFRPSKGLWAIRGLTRFYYGRNSDWAVPADYIGDLMDDIGIFRPGQGLWAVKGTTIKFYFGGSGDQPATR